MAEINASDFFKAGGNTVANLVGITPDSDGATYDAVSFYNDWEVPAGVPTQGGKFEYQANRLKSEHNGLTIISPTVPWNGKQSTLGAFQAKTGETDQFGRGCWVAVDASGLLNAWQAPVNKLFGQILPAGALSSGAVNANSTWRVAQNTPRHFKRVRCHMFNRDQAASVTGAKAQISLSESFANGSRPTIGGVLSNAGWNVFQFAGSTTVNIAAAAVAGVPTIVTSDWLALDSRTVTLASGLEYPVVYADRYIPAGNTAQIGFCSPGAGWSAYVNGLAGTKHQAYFYAHTSDAIANPASFTTTAQSGAYVPMMLEFEFVEPTATLMCFGDSTKEGAVNVANAGPAIMVQALLDAVNKPMSSATFAQSGLTAALSYSRLVAMLAVTRPTVLYFQPYSINDSNYAGSATAALTRAQQVVDLCNSKQIRLVLETPMPIVASGGAAISNSELNALQSMETGILQFESANVKVLDMRVLHDPAKPGVWSATYGQDNAHPNPAGCIVQANKLFDAVVQLI